MKTIDRLWRLKAMLAIVLCIAACKESDDVDSNTSDPTTPINNSDWQTVPATGGTIEKGDIALTFPSGTFDADTKVAITEVKKGNIGGEYEASPFYQITMPATTGKPVTVKMKSTENGDDIGYVINTPAWAPSTLTEVQHDSFLETRYVDGEYTTTIPAIDNGEEPDNVSFTLGLGRMPDYDAAATRASSWKNRVIHSGEVEGVKYEIYISWGTMIAYMKSPKDLYTLEVKSVHVGEVIEETIRQIHKLGFRLEGEGRTIPFYYEYYKEYEAPRGEFIQDRINGNWWSCILLNTRNLLSDVKSTGKLSTNMKQTIIHETFHYYQADYDPRYWSLIKGSSVNNETLIMYEMGAVWIEKFMNSGKLNANFQLSEQGLKHCFDNQFRLGVPDKAEDLMGLYPGKEKIAYQQQGYALAPLLYHMIKKKKAEDKSVHSLYYNWKLAQLPIAGYVGTSTVVRLGEWYDNTFTFFSSSERVDEYYLSLFKGDIMDEFSIASFELMDKSRESGTKVLNGNIGKGSMVGKVYPNGCEGLLVELKSFDVSDLANYEFVVKQEEKGVHTQVLYTDMKTVTKVSGKATQTDSIVIAGETLKSMYERYKHAYLFLLTTWDEPGAYTKGTMSTNTWYELRKPSEQTMLKATPTELTFEAAGGKETVKVEAKGYKYYGGFAGDDCDDWVTVKTSELGSFTVTASANKTTDERTGTVYAFATNSTNPTLADTKLLPIKVTQAAADGNASVTPTLIEFPAYGGVSFVDTQFDYEYASNKFVTGPTGLLKRTWGAGIYKDQIYVTAGLNTSGKATVDTLMIGFTNDRDMPFDRRYKIPVVVKQKAGPATLQDMIKIMQGTWISTEESNDTWQIRLKVEADGSYSRQDRDRSNSTKPWSNWRGWTTGDFYTVTSYEQFNNGLTIHVKNKKDNAEPFFAIQPHAVIYYGWHLVKEN